MSVVCDNCPLTHNRHLPVIRFLKAIIYRIVFLTQGRQKRHVAAFLIELTFQRKGEPYYTFWITVIMIDKPFVDGCFLDSPFYFLGQLGI